MVDHWRGDLVELALVEGPAHREVPSAEVVGAEGEDVFIVVHGGHGAVWVVVARKREMPIATCVSVTRG